MVVATNEFVTAAEAQSKSLGYSAVARVFTPHPIQDRTDDEMRAYADAAFDEIVARYKGRLYSFTLRMVKDPSLAEEMTQETLIRVYMHADKYREIAKFSTWVFTIATNLVRNRMRQQSRAPRLLRSSTVSLPMPVLQPVMTTVLPSMRTLFSYLPPLRYWRM